ncbi:Uncharacterized protein Fot_33254 [Forsythia ovata]|uniref:Uncharacterized protein n=1 Tax=Forsythia ovata TaxID=205694 RepID=A0ABD1TA45_9LAMI
MKDFPSDSTLKHFTSFYFDELLRMVNLGSLLISKRLQREGDEEGSELEYKRWLIIKCFERVRKWPITARIYSQIGAHHLKLGMISVLVKVIPMHFCASKTVL